jgi:hypothetical protein
MRWLTLDTRIEHLRCRKTKSGRLGACAASFIYTHTGTGLFRKVEAFVRTLRNLSYFSLVATNGWCSIASIPKRGSNLPASGHFANDLSMARDPLVSSSSGETRSKTGFSAFSALAMELEKRGVGKMFDLHQSAPLIANSITAVRVDCCSLRFFRIFARRTACASAMRDVR